MQKMQPLPDGTLPYKSTLDCASKILFQEGPLTFYTGFPTYIARWVTAMPGVKMDRRGGYIRLHSGGQDAE